jgi:hypothetical protein
VKPDELGKPFLKTFPDSLAALVDNAVVILGDVNPAELGETRMKALREWVGDMGGALIFLAGAKNDPFRYGGTPLEDTGINLAGPAGLLGLIALIAACVAFPPIGLLLLRTLPVLWGYFSRTTQAIGEFTAAHPDAGEELKVNLSRRMDEAHKALVRHKTGAVKT